MSTLRCALLALVSMAGAGCDTLPTAPTPNLEPILVEGNTGGYCVPQANFWAMWVATVTDNRQHDIVVTAYRDPEPGCSTTRRAPLAIRGYSAAVPPREVTFLLDHGRRCGRVEFVMTVDGRTRANTFVDLGVRCEGGDTQ